MDYKVLYAGFATFLIILGLLIWIAAGIQHVFVLLRRSQDKFPMDVELVMWALVILVVFGAYAHRWFGAGKQAPPVLVSASPSGAEVPSTRFDVGLRDFQFTPNDLTVPTGSTIVWVNHEGRHKVMADDESFESPILFVGDRFEHRFPYSGTFRYYCYFHGDRHGERMAGVIHVLPPLLP